MAINFFFSSRSALGRQLSANPNCEFVPYLSATDAGKAVDFYTRAFGVSPLFLLQTSDGSVMHCEFRIGIARFFLSEELPEHGGTSAAIHLYVDDCDAMVEAFVDNESTVLMAPEDVFWGERFARVRDPFGHEWGIATIIRDMTPDEIHAAAARMFDELPE